MHFNKGRQDKDDSLNFTAMIDVVFLLLIFFMCTASVQLPEREIKAAIPGISSTVPEFQPVKIELITTDNQHVSGSSGLSSGVVVICDGLVCPDDAALRNSISARSKIADLPVVFSIDEEILFNDIVHVMDICRSAGLKKIAIPTSQLN